jgi:hypothetical protein
LFHFEQRLIFWRSKVHCKTSARIPLAGRKITWLMLKTYAGVFKCCILTGMTHTRIIDAMGNAAYRPTVGE